MDRHEHTYGGGGGDGDREGAATHAANKTRQGMSAPSRATPGDLLQALEAAAMLRRGGAADLRAGLLRLAGARLAAAGALRLVGDGLGLAPPLAVYAIVRFVQAPPTAQDAFAARYFGYAVGAALFFASALRAVCLHLHRRLAGRAAGRARSALAALVLDKALTLSAQATRAAGGLPAVVALSTLDTGRVRDLLASLDSLVAAPLQLALGAALLAKLLGVRAALAGLAVLVLAASPVAYALASRLAALSLRSAARSERRAALVAELLGHIQVVKLCAWEPPLLARVESARALELQSLRGEVVWLAARSTLARVRTGPMVAAVAALAVVVAVQAAPLSPDRAFPAVALLAVLQEPIAEVPRALAALAQAHASLRRIEAFVAMDEFKPLPLAAADSPTPRGATSPTRPHRDDPPFELRSAVFRLDAASARALRTISSRDLTASASADAPLKVLARLSVVVPRGKLTLVVGAPGSGKSTLMAALAGELAPESGFVNLPRAGTVSLAPQTPFVMPGRSVRDNVLFGSALDQERMDAVLAACELDAALPDGPSTVVGDTGDADKGVWAPDEALKQRIALARAVYAWARTELFVVDDALSLLPPVATVRVLRRCLLGEDALLAGTTRVLAMDAAANPETLELARAADWIVVMDQGKAAQAGSFADLTTRQPFGRFAQLVAALEATPRLEDAAAESVGDGGSSRGSRVGSSSGSSRRRSSTVSAQDAPEPAPWSDEAHGSAPWRTYASYWSACGPLTVAGASGALVAAQLAAVSMDLWLANWTGDASLPSFASPAPLAAVGLSIYAYLGVVTLALACLGDVTARYAGLSASKGVHERLLRLVTKGSMRFLAAAPLDRVLARFSADMATIDRSLAAAVVDRAGRALALAGMLAVLLAAAPLPMLALLAPVLACYVPLHAHVGPRLRAAREREAVAGRAVASAMAQTLRGVATVRVFGMTAAARRQLAVLADTHARAAAASTALVCWLDAQLDGLGAVLTLLVMSVVAAGRAGEAAGAMAGLALVYALDSARELAELTRRADDLGDAMRSVGRVDALCDAASLASEPLTLPPRTLPSLEEALGGEGGGRALWSAALALRPQWPERGQLNLVNVSLALPAVAGSLGPPPPLLQLRGVSLAVRGGDKVGVLTADGSVERPRALLWALLRLEPTSGGRVEVDGVPVVQLDLRDLRGRIAAVPRAPLVLSGESLRANLDPRARASDAELWAALRAAGVAKAAATAAAAAAAGALALDAPFDERSARAWGRRLWLARALLRRPRPRVLCVDALDVGEPDDGVADAARALPELRAATVVLVARRAASVTDYDQVVVLDGRGRVAEHGPPPQLLRERPDGPFARLLDAEDDWTPAV